MKNKPKIGKEKALQLAREWQELHDEAQSEEAAECFSASERLLMDAADIERDLHLAGYSASDLWQEIEAEQRKKRRGL